MEMLQDRFYIWAKGLQGFEKLSQLMGQTAASGTEGPMLTMIPKICLYALFLFYFFKML